MGVRACVSTIYRAKATRGEAEAQTKRSHVPAQKCLFFRSHRNALWIPRLASRPPLPRHLLIWQEVKGRRDVNDTFASSAASVLAALAASPLKRRRVRCLSRRACWRKNTTDSSASQWIFLPGGHRAKRSLDRPSRVPQKWHFSWFPTHFPLLCCSRLSLLPHPASHWAPIFIPPLSPALVKQTGCCLPCGSLSFFFFFPSIWSISNPFQGSSAVQQPQNAARTVYLPLFVSPALTADGLGWGCNSGWTHPAWIIYTLQMNNAQRVKVKEIERGLSVGVLDAGGASNGFQIRSPIWACFRPRGVCELYIFSSSWHSSESRRLKARTLTLPFPLTATAAAVFFFGLFCFGL